jgi:hypothetical protein
MNIPSLEARMAHVEGIVDELRARLASIENRLDRLEDRINSLEGRMQTNFLGIVGILVSMWITLTIAILLG